MKSSTTDEKYSIYHGIAMNTSLNMMGGYIPLFALSVIGTSNQQVGLLYSLPSIISMLAILPGAYWINRMNSIRNFTAVTTMLARFIFMLIIFSPFLSKPYASWFLILFYGLWSFPGALANLSWQTMIGDLIPENRRNQFFSTRNRAINLAVLVVILGTGLFLQQFDKGNAIPYQILFLAAFAFGVLEVYFLYKHKEMTGTAAAAKKVSSKIRISELFKQKPYVSFVICAILFHIGWQMAWSLFSIYTIREAHATALWISLFAVSNQVAQIISVKLWARFSDKYGNMMMLFVASVGMATAPFLNILSTNLYYLTIVNFSSGIFVAGTVLLLFNQLLHVSPTDNRATYLANYNLLISFVGFLSPQIGVVLLDTFGMNTAMTSISVLRFFTGFPFLFVALKYKKTQKNIAI